jgi:hypothetical protein
MFSKKNASKNDIEDGKEHIEVEGDPTKMLLKQGYQRSTRMIQVSKPRNLTICFSSKSVKRLNKCSERNTQQYGLSIIKASFAHTSA